MGKLDTMNHEQRARFGRNLFSRRRALPRTLGTKLLLKQISGGKAA